MSDYFLLGILLALCLGQVVAVRKGKLTAVTYYICVSWLGYFSIWEFITWDPNRLCGIILIIGCWLQRKKYRADTILSAHRYNLILLYSAAVTAVESMFWPVEAMAGHSAAYGWLRGLVQIGNWAIMLEAGWWIGIVFAQPDAFERARYYILCTGMALCLYGCYQYVAFEKGLPTTGIRRPLELAVDTDSTEQFAAFMVGDESIFRPGSFVGEPKALGAACVVWLALLVGILIVERTSAAAYICFGVILATLWLTGSTSAWVSAFGGIVLTASVTIMSKLSRSHFRAFFRLILLSFVITFLFGLYALFNQERLAAIFEVRLTTRMQEPLADLPEQMAWEVLAERPYLAVFGTGPGGISFYIAELLQGSQHLILVPNNGLLSLVCDIGLVGLAIMSYSLWPGLCLLYRRNAESTAVMMSLVGTVTIVQCLIFPQPCLVSLGCGFLLAASLRRRPARHG